MSPTLLPPTSFLYSATLCQVTRLRIDSIRVCERERVLYVHFLYQVHVHRIADNARILRQHTHTHTRARAHKHLTYNIYQKPFIYLFIYLFIEGKYFSFWIANLHCIHYIVTIIKIEIRGLKVSIHLHSIHKLM